MVPVTEAKRTREVESFIVKILVQEELRLNVLVLLTRDLMVVRDNNREARDCSYTRHS
jgi:hypothetical protein